MLDCIAYNLDNSSYKPILLKVKYLEMIENKTLSSFILPKSGGKMIRDKKSHNEQEKFNIEA